ncbi:Copalyl diphosphate synthase [Xylaria telfairii]|nr:Copalyl diphosphate synthase [Xylaria telfairii]
MKRSWDIAVSNGIHLLICLYNYGLEVILGFVSIMGGAYRNRALLPNPIIFKEAVRIKPAMEPKRKPETSGYTAYNTAAISLVKRAAEGYDKTYGAGFMSCVVYDTAWVSLITKPLEDGGRKEWLFPQCFAYLLATQSDDGGWGHNGGSQVDGILNTAVSLLSLKRHLAEPLNIPYHYDLERRVEKATSSLRSQLAAWDFQATRHVGFEIILPALLRYLEEEAEAVVFDFHVKDSLETLNSFQLSQFQPERLYGQTKSSYLCSLEAMIGLVDFDKLSQHKWQGSMMGSPSSTAAYLMHVSSWDDEAEEYLKHVIAHGSGQGSGGVPNVYPSTQFEYSWSLSNLFRAGFSISDLECSELHTVTQVLRNAFERGDGVVGFAQNLEADLDNTAQGILSMAFLGRPVKVEKMIQRFEVEGHFRTYSTDPVPSLSANCHALRAILSQSDIFPYNAHIKKAVKFICDFWWNSDAGVVEDKWNSSRLYSSLALVETMVDVLALIDHGSLANLLGQDLESRVLVTVFQCCLWTLLKQEDNGSWNSSIEESAYAVLVLSEARRVAMFTDLESPLASALERGLGYLRSFHVAAPAPLWVDKVTSSSVLIRDSYVLAALRRGAAPPPERKVATSIFNSSRAARGRKHVKLLKMTPLFSQLPEWEIQASMIESVLFQPMLHARRLDIFPRKNMEDDNKYFDIIPFTWTSCNNRQRTFAPATFLYEMMIISFLNYQADEFMEVCAGTVFQGRTDALRQLIDKAFLQDLNNCQDLVLGSSSIGDIGHSSYVEVLIPLIKFVSYVSNHPYILEASKWDRESMKRELRTFLHAHATQLEDNTRFQDQPRQTQQHPAYYESSTDSFFHWVRTTSADHTSCPYSFSFVGCLMSARLLNGRDCFPSVHEKYLAAVACRHLATMCRMYNDYGSIGRDASEGNLNSINFPEYYQPGSGDGVGAQKRALFELAEYERVCLDESIRRLTELSRKTGDANLDRAKGRQMAIWRMFCDVTDLYGQIYVVRDIGTRTAAPVVGMGSALGGGVRAPVSSEGMPCEPSQQPEKAFKAMGITRTGLVLGH